MTFICLAAGKGTRFGSLGSYLQKCMYPVGLKPFLEYSLESLLSSGVFQAMRDRLVLVVGHRQEQIRHYFGISFGNVPIHYVEQGAALGTGHAVRTGYDAAASEDDRLATAGREPALVWLADAYITPETFAGLAAHPAENAVTVARYDDGEPYGHRVDLDPERAAVTRVWKGQSPYVETGSWKLSAAALRTMTQEPGPDGEYRALPALQRLIEAGETIGYVETPEWIHLGGTKPSPEYHLRRVFATLAPELNT